jgi:hypothetical protein
VSFSAKKEQIYLIYLTPHGIELHVDNNQYVEGRFICAQKNYRNILDFGNYLARQKALPFINRITPSSIRS